jgi:hypothetical protein
MDKDCYRFELLKYDYGVFDNFVDITYIITLEGNGRLENIYNQLSNIIPTKNVFIVYNKGYKKCNKELIVYNSINDIVDVNMKILKHANNNKYNNILVLEDDFIFSDNIKNPNIINEINLFFSKNKNIPFSFNLGPIPVLFYPNIINNIKKNIFSTNAHAIIYNNCLINRILKNSKLNYPYWHWDVYLNLYKQYFYKNPIIYQTYPLTENRKIWTENMYINNFINYIIKYNNLDKTPQPGFKNVYNTSFFINYFIFILMIIIIIYTIYKIYGGKKYEYKGKNKRFSKT